MEKYYTIKDISEKTGMSAHTLRFYDKKGLLTFVKRSESGIRLFTDKDLENLYTIHCLKESGMSLAKIKEFMELFAQGNSTIPQRKQLMEEHRKTVLEEIGKLNRMLQVIDYKCWLFEEAKKYNDVYFYEHLEEIPLPVQEYMQKVEDYTHHGL